MQAPPPVESLLRQLATTAEYVESLTQDKTLDWRRRPAENQWSLTEIVCHLRDVEREVHQHRFRSLIEAENAFVPGVSADEWAEARHYRRQNARQAVEDFLAARRESIAMLEVLGPSLWERHGRHAFFGPTSLHELLYLAVRHDEAHRQQIGDLLADMSKDA